MKSITIINIQIGQYKNYFPLFLNSCINNPTINFLLVSDQKIKCSDAPNLIIKYMCFDEIRTRICDLFDFPINLSSAYDLCDYKVTYGELFANELKNTEFWGFCDTDLIFGDIRRYITDEILDAHDKILIRGHFTLFRNDAIINTIYRRKLKNGIERYKDVFMDAGVHHFDEGMPYLTNGINTLFADYIGWNRVYDAAIFMDLDVESFHFINADFKEEDEENRKAKNSYFYYNHGRLFRVNCDGTEEEYMYIHFQKRKMDIRHIREAAIDEYYIVPNRFLPIYNTSKKVLRNANRKRIYWSRLYVIISGKIKRGFRRLFK